MRECKVCKEIRAVEHYHLEGEPFDTNFYLYNCNVCGSTMAVKINELEEKVNETIKESN